MQQPHRNCNSLLKFIKKAKTGINKAVKPMIASAEAETSRKKGGNMDIKFVKRSFLQRLFGTPATPKPSNPDGWTYSDGKLSIDLKKTKELKKPGGAIRFEGGDLPARVLVVFGKDKQYRAYKNRCTHIGHRRLDPVPGTDTVQCCSVNKSTYDAGGNKIYGPAPKPITVYATKMEKNRLVVTLE